MFEQKRNIIEMSWHGKGAGSGGGGGEGVCEENLASLLKV